MTTTLVRTGPVRIEGYDVDGPRHVLLGPDEAPRWFIQRSTGRGRPWLRFLKKPADLGGYWVSAYKTLTLAKES